MSVVSWLVDRYHVGTPFAEIEADIRARAKKAKATPQQTSAYVAEAKKVHEENRRLYVDVMRGF